MMSELASILVLNGSEGPLPPELAGERAATAAGLPDVRALQGRGLVIAPRASSLRALTRTGAPGPVRRLRQGLLVLEPVEDQALLRVLERMFARIVFASEGLQLLPIEELIDAVRAPNRGDLFIGGVVDVESGDLLLYRGDLDLVVFPVAHLPVRAGGPTPDLERLRFTDYGQTVAFGEYEASADAILYDMDPHYRRAARKRQIQEDASFGASVRRLRLLRGLSRADFPELSEKEIARIERGEVERPHPSTLLTIAKRLGVTPDDLGTY
jgi:DNA-binding Xre family transcriptional regulator